MAFEKLTHSTNAPSAYLDTHERLGICIRALTRFVRDVRVRSPALMGTEFRIYCSRTDRSRCPSQDVTFDFSYLPGVFYFILNFLVRPRYSVGSSHTLISPSSAFLEAIWALAFLRTVFCLPQLMDYHIQLLAFAFNLELLIHTHNWQKSLLL